MATFRIKNKESNRLQTINVVKSTKSISYNLSTGIQILSHEWDFTRKRVKAIGVEAKTKNKLLHKINEFVDKCAKAEIAKDEVSLGIEQIVDGEDPTTSKYTIEKTYEDYTKTDIGFRVLKMLTEWVDIEKMANTFRVDKDIIGESANDVVLYILWQQNRIKNRPKEIEGEINKGNKGLLWISRIMQGNDYDDETELQPLEDYIEEDLAIFLAGEEQERKINAQTYLDYYLKHKHPGNEPAGYRNAWKHFHDYLKGKKLSRFLPSDITGQILEGYMFYLESLGRKPTYIGRLLGYVKTIIEYYAEYEVYSLGRGFNHIKKKQQSGENDIAFLQRELDQLKTTSLTNGSKPENVMAGANLHRWLFLCQCAIGVRVSDLFRLKPENLRMGKMEVVIDQKKTKAPVVAECIDTEAWEKLVYIVENGLNNISPDKYNKGIKKVIQKAGIQPLSLNMKEKEEKWYTKIASHNARRSYICNHYLKYRDIERTRQNAGHMKIDETLKYKRSLDTLRLT